MCAARSQGLFPSSSGLSLGTSNGHHWILLTAQNLLPTHGDPQSDPRKLSELGELREPHQVSKLASLCEPGRRVSAQPPGRLLEDTKGGKGPAAQKILLDFVLFLKRIILARCGEEHV